jgi:hypothetical protein
MGAVGAMEFFVRDGAAVGGRLTYAVEDHGFRFEAGSREELAGRLGDRGVTSVVIDTLQLEVDIASGDVLFAWGYFPLGAAETGELAVPEAREGRVRVVDEEPFEPGVSVGVPGERWRTSYDRTTGVVAVRLREAADAVFVRIADGVVLGVDGAELVAVWLGEENRLARGVGGGTIRG